MRVIQKDPCMDGGEYSLSRFLTVYWYTTVKNAYERTLTKHRE